MIGYGENLGSGFPLILNAWNEKHWLRSELLKQPELMQVKLTLHIQNEPINVKVAEHINTAHLTDRQRKIYDIINNGTVNGTVNAQNLSAALDISLRTAKRDLYVLRDMNLIHYVGSDKTGHWEIVKPKSVIRACGISEF